MKKYVIPILIVAALIVAVVIVATRGNDNNASNTTQPSSSDSNSMSNMSSSSSNSQTPTSTDKVSIADFAFSPTNITVKKGTKVTWTNNDSTAHTVTADSGSGPDSGTLSPGQTYSFTFINTGTFNYHCTIHSEMHGTVTVAE